MALRVLMFGWEFPPYNSGGLGTACEGLCSGLLAEGAEVTFVMPHRTDVSFPGLSFLFADTDAYRQVLIPSPLSPYLDSSSYLALGLPFGLYAPGLLEEVLRYGMLARELAKNESFDVIHAHDWLSFPAGLAAKEVSGKPLIVHVHATEFDRTGGPEGINKTVYAIEREGMHRADKVVTVSGFTKDMVVSRYGVSADKVTVVHNATSPLPPPVSLPLMEEKAKGKKIVLFVGRLTLQKGPDYFLRAAKLVLEHEPNTLFVIAGSGDMEGQVVRDTARLGLGGQVLFAGFARGAELSSLYQAADLFVLPSVSEPFGITPLESLSAGTPVIVSKQSGVAEVLTHALKVDFWDVDEMANQIVALLRNPSLSNQLSSMGQGEAVKLSWRDSAKKCLVLYQSFKNHLEK
jgi:glycosyltransferase involved in cell wall biosynthesis